MLRRSVFGMRKSTCSGDGRSPGLRLRGEVEVEVELQVELALPGAST